MVMGRGVWEGRGFRHEFIVMVVIGEARLIVAVLALGLINEGEGWILMAEVIA